MRTLTRCCHDARCASAHLDLGRGAPCLTSDGGHFSQASPDVSSSGYETPPPGIDGSISSTPGFAPGTGPGEAGEGGTTAVVCICVSGQLHLASVGDSRAVMRVAGERASRLTVDHTPNLPAETDRITELGGFITRGRVHGILAVSRALGDVELQPFVSPEPQLGVVKLRRGKRCLLLIASDGLWGSIGDDEATEMAAAHADPQGAADALLAEVARRGGRDNASIVVAEWGGSSG